MTDKQKKIKYLCVGLGLFFIGFISIFIAGYLQQFNMDVWLFSSIGVFGFVVIIIAMWYMLKNFSKIMNYEILDQVNKINDKNVKLIYTQADKNSFAQKIVKNGYNNIFDNLYIKGDPQNPSKNQKLLYLDDNLGLFNAMEKANELSSEFWKKTKEPIKYEMIILSFMDKVHDYDIGYFNNAMSVNIISTFSGVVYCPIIYDKQNSRFIYKTSNFNTKIKINNFLKQYVKDISFGEPLNEKDNQLLKTIIPENNYIDNEIEKLSDKQIKFIRNEIFDGKGGYKIDETRLL